MHHQTPWSITFSVCGNNTDLFLHTSHAFCRSLLMLLHSFSADKAALRGGKKIQHSRLSEMKRFLGSCEQGQEMPTWSHHYTLKKELGDVLKRCLTDSVLPGPIMSCLPCPLLGPVREIFDAVTNGRTETLQQHFFLSLHFAVPFVSQNASCSFFFSFLQEEGSHKWTSFLRSRHL